MKNTALYQWTWASDTNGWEVFVESRGNGERWSYVSLIPPDPHVELTG